MSNEAVTRELIVDASADRVTVAVLEDGLLAEFQREQRDVAFAVGDIYLGTVKKVMPGLNAAFVDVGFAKDAFLHYSELGRNFLEQQSFLEMVSRDGTIPPLAKVPKHEDLPKEGRIADYVRPGQPVLVQITKEPISTKGPSVSCDISIAGRNLVLRPFGESVTVSNKIDLSAERTRLKQIITSLRPPKRFGIIVRTSATDAKASQLDAEMRGIIERWEIGVGKLKGMKAPRIIYEEPSRILGLLRDTFDSSFNSIRVNDQTYHEAIRDYVAGIAPDKVGIVQLYKGNKPILQETNIAKQIKNSFGRTVTFKGGAYLVVEQTEAMLVIDVNSGNRARRSENQEQTALDVNLAAAKEIARQLRLRDMGGLVVIDFIDMQKPENRDQLYKQMKQYMEADRARHNILPISKMGLMQITRQRVRPATTVRVDQKCPSCDGTGKITAGTPIAEEIEVKLKYLFEDPMINYINLHVHPYVAAFLTKGLISIATKWRIRLGKVKITADESLPILDYRMYDRQKENLLEQVPKAKELTLADK